MLPLHKKIERERESNDVIKSIATEQFIFFLKSSYIRRYAYSSVIKLDRINNVSKNNVTRDSDINYVNFIFPELLELIKFKKKRIV